MMLAIVVLAAVAIYANALVMGFVWDDIHEIVEPGPIRSLENIPWFFSNSVSAGHKFANATPYYRPLFSLSNAIDYALWEGTPFGYHLTNILLHAIVSGLVFMIVKRMIHLPVSALFGGLVYALHPVHAEAVVYVSARNELLCALFMTASFCLYLKWRDNMIPSRLMMLQVLFFPALLSKEMAVTMPLLIGCYEITVGEYRLKQAFLRAFPFVVTVVLYLFLRSMVLDVTSWDAPPMPVRTLTGITLMFSYLRLLIFPLSLKTLYDIPLQWELLQAEILLVLFVILTPVILAIYLYRRNKVLCFGISWIYLALIPASGLPTLIMPAYMAERYLYIPSIGFAFICGRLLELTSQKLSKQASTLHRVTSWHMPCLTVVMLMLVAYSVLTVVHKRNWKDEPTLYKAMIHDAPDHQIGYDLLGSWYGKRQNDNLEMAKYYMQSMILAKKHQLALGDSYMKYGYYEKAEGAYLQLLVAGYGDESIRKRLAAAFTAKNSTR